MITKPRPCPAILLQSPRSRADFLIREEITVAEFYAVRTAAGRIYAYSVRPVSRHLLERRNYLVE